MKLKWSRQLLFSTEIQSIHLKNSINASRCNKEQYNIGFQSSFSGEHCLQMNQAQQSRK